MSGAIFLALRRLRFPLAFLIAVYAVGIAGLVLIPAVTHAGEASRISFFHAFYFLTYTATTIGFGELPHQFTEFQRLWVTVTIYLSVFAWAFTVVSLIALAQDRAFRHALTVQRFGRRVRRLPDAFYIVCGYGETGQRVCRALDARGFRLAVLDLSEERISELELQDFRSDVYGLVADAREPENLLRAGLRHHLCRGVIALADDESNLAVSVAVHLLNSKVSVVTRATSEALAANMKSFGADYIVKPFAAFTDLLRLALAAPAVYRLAMRLDEAPGTPIRELPLPPRGRWLVCGYGALGEAAARALDAEGNEITVIDPKRRPGGRLGYVQGVGTEPMVLGLAGIGEAVGIVASTDDDIRNMAISVAAREKNPRLYEIVRQRRLSNAALFVAFQAEMTMVVSDLIAKRVLSIVDAPLFDRFFRLLSERDGAWATEVSARLDGLVGPISPWNWGVVVNAAGAPALHRAMMLEGERVTLEALLLDPADRSRTLSCLALLLVRSGKEILLPPPQTLLEPGDSLLFAGNQRALRAQRLTLTDVNNRDYVLHGSEPYRSWIFEWFARKRPTG